HLVHERLLVGLAEGHGAEAQGRDLEAAPAERAILHVVLPFGARWGAPGHPDGGGGGRGQPPQARKIQVGTTSSSSSSSMTATPEPTRAASRPAASAPFTSVAS